MQRIEQREDNDCGVACVAMLIQRYAGIPFEKAYDCARLSMFADKATCSKTNGPKLYAELKKFGVKCTERLVELKTATNEKGHLEKDAILWARVGKYESGHWMVWDAKAKVILDPLKTAIFPMKLTKCLLVDG